MDNKKLAEKIAGKILKMGGPRDEEGCRLAIMFRDDNGKETSPGGRNKSSLIVVIEEILNEFNNFK